MKNAFLVVAGATFLTAWSSLAAIVVDPGPAERPTVPVAQPVATNVASPVAVDRTTNAAPAKERPLTLVLELQDTCRIVGVPSEAKLPMETSFGNMEVLFDKLESIQWGSTNDKATVTFRNGDHVSGSVSAQTVNLTTSFGQAKIPVGVMSRLSVIPGGKDLTAADGLVLYYSFDQQPEGQVVTDLSGQGHDGTFIGAQWAKEGWRGGGCVISGGTDELRAAKTDKFVLEEFSISLWLKRANRDRVSDGGHIGVLIGYNTFPGHVILGVQPDGQIFIDGTDSVRQVVACRIPDLEWHHVALVKKGGMMTVYMDGKERGQFQYKVFADFRQGLSFGSVGGKIGYPFVGMLDEIRIFSRPLSSEEVKQLSQPKL